jgi:hypothetical protein
MYRFEDFQPDILRTESGGDYNALFGYQNRPGGRFENVQVTNMTIGDILDFQNPRGAYGQYVAGARPDRQRGVATPVGAYQIVGTTLRDAVRALNLPLDTKFTPEVQDQVARYIFETQGPQAWQGLGINQNSGENVAAATMSALGRGGNMNGSGLLAMAGGQPQQADMMQQQRRGINPDFLDRLTIAMEGLSMRPNTTLMQMAQGNIQQRREQQQTMAQRNATAQWLSSRGREDLAQLVMQGVLTGAQALQQMSQRREPIQIDGRLIDPDTYEVLYESPAQGPDNDAIRQARTEFTGLPEVRNFAGVASSYGRVVASAEDPSPAGDLALIFNYMKVLDPGSVVREGEFATAQNAGSVDDRTRSLYNRVLEGTRLSEEQRRDFLDRAGRLYSGAENQYRKIADQYSEFARAAGLPVEQVIPDFTYFAGVQETPSIEIPPAPEGYTEQEWRQAWQNMTPEQRALFTGGQ